MQFDNFDVDHFLNIYWQKKPLLIRNPWRNWENPLLPDELAGLACEAEIESRLVVQMQKNGQPEWISENGPFDAERFEQLNDERWTLLVQAADHYIPEVAALIEPFSFIPDWRIDDVMVSYASDHGGVGPHFDQYDVFLIQGHGQRRWQIGQKCNSASALQPNENLRLLAEFDVQEEWVLSAGDMLYIPPGIAHNGVAVGGECMTYSVGFRAPSRGELIGNFCDHLLDNIQDDDRYTDPQLPRQPYTGEIEAGALDRMHQMVLANINDRNEFARWFGTYNSTPKYPDIDWTPDEQIAAEELQNYIADNPYLLRNPASRFAFIRQSQDMILLFVDGECFECGPDIHRLAVMLSDRKAICLDAGMLSSQQAIILITKLLNKGSLAFADND